MIRHIIETNHGATVCKPHPAGTRCNLHPQSNVRDLANGYRPIRYSRGTRKAVRPEFDLALVLAAVLTVAAYYYAFI